MAWRLSHPEVAVFAKGSATRTPGIVAFTIGLVCFGDVRERALPVAWREEVSQVTIQQIPRFARLMDLRHRTAVLAILSVRDTNLEVELRDDASAKVTALKHRRLEVENIVQWHKKIVRIAAAPERVDRGTRSICAGYAEDVFESRLHAIPWSARCLLRQSVEDLRLAREAS